jgi:hypothetical protein
MQTLLLITQQAVSVVQAAPTVSASRISVGDAMCGTISLSAQSLH